MFSPATCVPHFGFLSKRDSQLASEMGVVYGTELLTRGVCINSGELGSELNWVLGHSTGIWRAEEFVFV